MEGTFLVTGAASGIGAAICRRIAGLGANIAVHTGTQRDKAEAVAADCNAKGAQTLVITGDLANASVPAALVAATVARFGGLDGLIANAGFADKKTLADLDDAILERSLDVMVKGLFRLAKAAQPSLIASKRGRIVAVSSFVAHVFKLQGTVFTASAAAKAGLEALARSMAMQFAPHNVTVNCVVPGFIQKDPGTHAALDADGWKRVVAQVPLGRLGLPDDVAATVCHLLSPDAAYITGQSIHVNGGLNL
ncbi:MAG: SDR family NAD(P)-dependent oxidoreductase [Burkholderiales bacterium]